MESITDTVNRAELDRLIDLALVKRQAARRYARKRHALRALVKLGVFSPEQARREWAMLAELLATWRAARALLTGTTWLVFNGAMAVLPGQAHFNNVRKV